VNAPFEVTRLESIPSMAAPDAPAWKPVRDALGIDAFGVDAFTADRAGDTVIAEHAEPEGLGGRQALYVVLAGAARFRLDGRDVDAPVGTLLFVRDPAVRRQAQALAPGTTVLAVSTPAAAEPEPEAAEPAAAAPRPHPEAARLHYNLACYAALAGKGDEALQHLCRAVELEPDAAEWARGDADLDRIRTLPGFPA
jgi:hypothetical protein